MLSSNKAFEPKVISEYQDKMKKLNQNFIISDSEDNSDEYCNFFFVGMYEGKEVIYDAVMYTLRLHHLSEVYEVAEHKAARHFPEFKKIKYREDENGDLVALDDLEEEIGLFIAEAIMEIEEEEEVKVKEHVEVDPNIDFGIGLDIGLNRETIDKNTISDFVKRFNEDTLELDETLYSFQTQDEELA
ncbi:MAG: hypothetical protein RLO81_09485 [Fulvivirga sp.]|uniref:hypothetical protein n=1 Tax=Fulvivirga sp. TaxID=1931237 RepID=UPI0032EC104D